MPRNSKGFFIVLEGPDKSGKSTQAAMLTRALLQARRKAIHTREPGGTSVPFAEKIRELLLDPDNDVHPISELLLYEAARVQHVEELVRPAVEKGAVVVCERFTLATLVYQGYARGLDKALVKKLNRIATNGLSPDLTLVLDIPESQFLQRDPERDLDRFELETARFRRRVREGYRKAAKSEAKTVLIDGTQPKFAVHREIVERVAKLTGIRLSSIPLEPNLVKSAP
jgi:dTMP kinase